MKKTSLSAMAFILTALCTYAQDFIPAAIEKMPPSEEASVNRMPAKASAAITPTGTQMWWGYFSESDYPNSNYGYNKACSIDAYICVPGGTEMVSGSTIKAIRLWFNSDISLCTGLKVWISRTEPASTDNVDYSQTVNPADMVSGINDIALDTPFAAGGGDIYVGYTATISGSAYFVSVGGAPTPNAFYYRNTISNSTKDYSSDGKLALQILIDGGSYPTDMAAVDDFGQGMVLKGETTTLPVTITNKGSNAIESISYIITTGNASPTAEKTVSVYPLAYNGQATVNIPFASDADTRKYSKEITITKVNGQPNGYSDNKASGTLITVTEKPQTTPVVEEFTGTWCGYCPYGIVGMQKAHETYGDKVALIAVHSGDVMELSAYSPVINRFADGYPSSRINRGGENVYPSSYYLVNYLNNALEKTTVGSIELSATWADEGKTKVKFDTQTKFAYSDDSGDYGIAYVLVEDGLKGTTSAWSQANYLSGGSGNDEMSFWYNSSSSVSGLEFDHVAVAAWDILYGVNGSVSTTFRAGQEMSHSYSADISQFSGIQDKERLTAMALLINRTNGTIVNAAQVKIGGEGGNEGGGNEGGGNEGGGNGGTSNVKGDVNGDGKVDVADIATIISIMAGYDEDNTPKGTVIYESPKGEEIYCNGIYVNSSNGSEAQYFDEYLSGLNRNHFSISFDYTPESQGWLMVLSHWYRVLGLYLNYDGKIRVTTNNQDNYYATNTSYTLNQSQHISLEYNGGLLTLNGEEIQVEMDETNGDNSLSSINYSNGGAYKGILKNIVVTTFE